MPKIKAQSVLEYAILLGVILLALMIMQVYVKRGYQGYIKQQADQVGQQYSPRHTTSVRIINTTINSTTNTTDRGLTYTLTHTNTTSEEREVIDAFRREDF